MQDSQTPPLRFCVQAKDRFVVRIIKIMDKSISSESEPVVTTGKPSSFCLNDTSACQKLLTKHVSQGGNIYVGFQAQLPAIVSRSTSADQVDSCSYQTCRKRKLGKGVRISFSCPLSGQGLKMEDFNTGLVAQRLEAWAISSGKRGLLNVILISLQKSVEELLTFIKKDGFQTVQPDMDYLFYPFTSMQLKTVKGPLHTTTCFRENSEYTNHGFETVPEPSSPISVHLGNLSLAYPQDQQSSVNSNTVRSVNKRNPRPVLANQCQTSERFLNGRPLSAYGPLFGNFESRNHLHPLNILTFPSLASAPEHFSAMHSAGIQHNTVFFPNDAETITAPYTDNHLRKFYPYSHQPSAVGSPMNYSEAALSEISEKNSLNPDSYNLPTEQNECIQYGRESEVFGMDTSQRVSVLNSIPSTCPIEFTSAFPISNEEELLAPVISEVVERLKRSPNLPLIIMPTQTSQTPSPPLVFQLSSPDLVFVGLPSNAMVRPRLITSPNNNAFVVASRRPGNTNGPATQIGDSTSRYVVATPKPGYMLAVTSDGFIREFKDSGRP